MAQDEKVQQKVFNTGDLEHRKSDTFIAEYANNVGVAAGFFDVQLIFGHIIPTYEKRDTPPYIEDRVGVTMSWEHAKALAKSIIQSIALYENINGPIREPKVLSQAPELHLTESERPTRRIRMPEPEKP